jgi:hypothetical protein
MKALRLPACASPVAYLFRFQGPRDPPLFVLTLRRSRMVGGPIRARAFGQPAAHLPAHSRADAGGISQVPRRSVLCLCPGPRPRPDRRPLDPDGVVDAAPAQPTAKAPAIIISRLLTRLRHLLPTLHDGRRRRHARLASGWLADLYREGVEPSGSRQKVSELHVHPPLLSFSCRKGLHTQSDQA